MNQRVTLRVSALRSGIRSFSALYVPVSIEHPEESGKNRNGRNEQNQSGEVQSSAGG